MSAATPAVHLVFGPVGAGKSTYARALASREAGVRFAIDDWMHELFAPDMVSLLDFGWIMARVRRCEQRIRAIAVDVLRTGAPVVLDLGLMKAESRAELRAWAAGQGHAVHDHFVHAPAPVRAQRVRQRNATRGETFSFEVTPMMFAFMEGVFEPPASAELVGATVIDTAPVNRKEKNA
jgi:predicted kinase